MENIDITTVSISSSGSESNSEHTQNDNLWDSLLHLNGVVTPETLQCINVLSKRFGSQKKSGSHCLILFEFRKSSDF